MIYGIGDLTKGKVDTRHPKTGLISNLDPNIQIRERVKKAGVEPGMIVEDTETIKDVLKNYSEYLEEKFTGWSGLKEHVQKQYLYYFFLRNEVPELNKKLGYYIAKGDFFEPNFLGLTTISYEDSMRSHRISGIYGTFSVAGDMASTGMRVAKAKSPSSINEGYLRECLALNLYSLFYPHNPETLLRQGVYPSEKYLKILILSKWEPTFREFKRFRLEGSKYNKYFVIPTGEGDFVSIKPCEHFFEQLPLLTLFWNKDSMGSHCQNKGTKLIDGKLVYCAIDEGFALTFNDSELTGNKEPPFRNMRDDFTFTDSASQHPLLNHSVFYDTNLTTLLQQVYLLLKAHTGKNPPEKVLRYYDSIGKPLRERLKKIKKDSDLEVFDNYISELQKFVNPDNKLAKEYKKLIKHTKILKKVYRNRRKKLILKFKKWLSIHDPNIINIIQNMQRLLATQTTLKEGNTWLRHLRIVSHADIDVQYNKKEGNEHEIKIVVNSHFEEIKEKLFDYIAKQNGKEPKIHGNIISIKFTGNDIPNLCEIFKEDYIKKYNHPNIYDNYRLKYAKAYSLATKQKRPTSSPLKVKKKELKERRRTTVSDIPPKKLQKEIKFSETDLYNNVEHLKSMLSKNQKTQDCMNPNFFQVTPTAMALKLEEWILKNKTPLDETALINLQQLLQKPPKEEVIDTLPITASPENGLIVTILVQTKFMLERHKLGTNIQVKSVEF